MPPTPAAVFKDDSGRALEVDLCLIDCDGVIYDSNNLKTEGYRQALREMAIPEADVERFIALHLSDVSISRFAKFRIFFNEMYHVPDPEAATKEAIERFGVCAQIAYSHLKPHVLALEFVRNFKNVFLISGGSEEELVEVFAEHGITPLFKGINGSPVTKQVHTKRILEEQGVAKERCVFIGDGFTDFKTAQEFGIHFVFLAEMSDWDDSEAKMSGAHNVTRCSRWEDVLAKFTFPSE